MPSIYDSKKMKIEFFERVDIFQKDLAQVLVNPVNCVGISGKGLALAFKNMYPDQFKVYKRECDKKNVKLGSVLMVNLHNTFIPYCIAYFPTKFHWRGKSYLKNIESGLEDLFAKMDKDNYLSVAIPALGCGLGGLDWKDVKKSISRIAAENKDRYRFKVIVVEPYHIG